VAEVRLQEGESWKRPASFKRKVIAEDIIKEVKRHSFYLKPGEKAASSKLWQESVPGKRFAKSRRAVATPRLLWPDRRFHGLHNIVRECARRASSACLD